MDAAFPQRWQENLAVLPGELGWAYLQVELTSQASRKGPKPDSSFEEKDDDDIDAGFDHILKMVPRSSCEMAQLRWQTNELRNKSSPIVGWPVALVSQALRNLAADGALARKEHHWQLPLTPNTSARKF